MFYILYFLVILLVFIVLLHCTYLISLHVLFFLSLLLLKLLFYSLFVFLIFIMFIILLLFSIHIIVCRGLGFYSNIVNIVWLFLYYSSHLYYILLLFFVVLPFIFVILYLLKNISGPFSFFSFSLFSSMLHIPCFAFGWGVFVFFICFPLVLVVFSSPFFGGFGFSRGGGAWVSGFWFWYSPYVFLGFLLVVF